MRGWIFFKNKIVPFLKRLTPKPVKKYYGIKQILMAGGYGYGNTGDEAQCYESARILKERYSDYQIKVLTPNPQYTYSQHSLSCDFASRVAFFNQGSWNNYYNFDGSLIKKLLFAFKSLNVLLNSYLVKAEIPTFLLNPSSVKLLQDIKESSLFYFCGGGYLTGKTLPRLWDGILLCKLCKILDTPIVMSGETIGLWENNLNKALAKWGFKDVKIITVRDKGFSLNDLEEIGIKENAFETHDDALFCEKSPLKLFPDKKYITMNFHYWGMSKSQTDLYIDKINKIVNHILDNTDYEIIFIPMVKSDERSYKDYCAKYPNKRVTCYEYDYDFRKIRSVISDSKLCITMKHHPIIFAFGEDVPVISIAFSNYYIHKNLGALAQYNQERFSINLEQDCFLKEFEKNFEYIMNNSEEVIKTISEAKSELAKNKEKFLKLVDKLVV